MKTYQLEEWKQEGRERFGDDHRQWQFVCPSCKTSQTIQDLIDAGVDESEVEGYMAFSCIGRFSESKGCKWTLGGLFQIHEAQVETESCMRPVFVFAEPSEVVA